MDATTTSKVTGKTRMVNAAESLTADGRGFGAKTKFDLKAEKAEWKKLAQS